MEKNLVIIAQGGLMGIMSHMAYPNFEWQFFAAVFINAFLVMLLTTFHDD